MKASETFCDVEHCLTPVADRLLCNAHVAELRNALDGVRRVSRDLELAIAKQARIKLAPSAATKPLPLSYIGTFDEETDRRILAQGAPVAWGPMALRDTLTAQLAATVRAVCSSRQLAFDGQSSMTGFAWWLLHHLDAVVQTPGCGRIEQAVSRTLVSIWRSVDTAPDRHYIGTCPTCGMPMHAPVGAELHACLYCRTEVDAQQMRSELLHEMRSELLTTGGLRSVFAYVGLDITRDRVRWIAQRGPHPLAAVEERDGVPVYRLGDFLDAYLVTSGEAIK